MMYFAVFIALFSVVSSFRSTSSLFQRNSYRLYGKAVNVPEFETPSFEVGEDIPEEIMQNNAIYDMILVERYNAPEKTSFGLFLPKVDGKDKKSLGKVLSVPSDYGLEAEGGLVLPIGQIAPYKKGDVVFIKDAWGIGPMNIELGPRCFSFHKAEHITAVVKSADSSSSNSNSPPVAPAPEKKSTFVFP